MPPEPEGPRIALAQGSRVPDVAIAVALNPRLDSLEQRFDEGFRGVAGHFDAIDSRLERLEQEGHAILQAVRRIEALLLEEQVTREIRERAWTS